LDFRFLILDWQRNTNGMSRAMIAINALQSRGGNAALSIQNPKSKIQNWPHWKEGLRTR
jgi:hypothetical protein